MEENVEGDNRETKKSFRKRFLQPLVDRILQPLIVPFLAVFTSLIVVAVVIIFTAESTAVGLQKLGDGYWGIVDGALTCIEPSNHRLRGRIFEGSCSISVRT